MACIMIACASCIMLANPMQAATALTNAAHNSDANRLAIVKGGGIALLLDAMQAFGQEVRQPRLCLRRSVRPGDADGAEAERPGALGQCDFDLLRVGQKSRSA